MLGVPPATSKVAVPPVYLVNYKPNVSMSSPVMLDAGRSDRRTAALLIAWPVTNFMWIDLNIL